MCNLKIKCNRLKIKKIGPSKAKREFFSYIIPLFITFTSSKKSTISNKLAQVLNLFCDVLSDFDHF